MLVNLEVADRLLGLIVREARAVVTGSSPYELAHVIGEWQGEGLVEPEAFGVFVRLANEDAGVDLLALAAHDVLDAAEWLRREWSLG